MKVMKFYATWCGPCKAMSKVLEEMDNLPEIEEIDIDGNMETASKFNIRSVPTLVVTADDGTEVKRYTGGASDRQALREFLEV